MTDYTASAQAARDPKIESVQDASLTRLIEEARADGWDEGVLWMSRHTGRQFPHEAPNPHRKD